MNLLVFSFNVIDRDVIISFIILSTFFFGPIYKITWTWTEPQCCNSYWITCSTLPITPLLKIILYYINYSNQLWNKIVHSTKQSFHVMFIWMFLINSSNWSIFAHFNNDISLDVKVKKGSITIFSSIINKSCKCDLCHLGEPVI